MVFVDTQHFLPHTKNMVIGNRLRPPQGTHTHVKAPLVGAELTRLARQKGLNPLQVSKRIHGAAYDHVRRVMKGEAFPGLGILEAILTVLDAKERLEEVKTLVLQDKGTYKGFAGAKLHKDQYFMTINTMWDGLDEEDKIEAVNYVSSLYRRTSAKEYANGSR